MRVIEDEAFNLYKRSKSKQMKDQSCKMREVAMDKELYNAAVKGNESFLTNAGDEYLLGKNQQNNHVVHIAVRHERLKFIREVVKRCPQLISEANSDGDNPLHLAAQTGNLDIIEMLVEFYKAQAQAQGDETKPWSAQNEEGNTPLHVALINHHVKVALFLVEQDGPELARICNNFSETPLHLAIKHRVDDDVKAVESAMKLIWEQLDNYVIHNIPCHLEKSSMCVIEVLLQKEHLVACWRDKEGFTPLLRAAKLCPSYLPAIKSIVEHCPESVEMCDGSGKTLLHLINKLPKYHDYKELFYSNPQVMPLKNHQDKDGNTPTHIALYNLNMDLFFVLLKSGVSLTVTNNEGVSVTDLIKLKSDQDFWKLYEYEQCEMIWSLLSDDKKIGPEAWLKKMKIIHAIDAKDIKFVRERIEKDGSSFLREKYFGENILHSLTRSGWQQVLESTEFTNFVQTILDKLPCLICERDRSGYGKTPLHCFVKVSPEMVNKPFLEMIKYYFERAKAEATTIEELCYDPPWKTKDEEGDTPLHMILDFPYESKWIRCARQIIEFDPTLNSQVNKRGENPLYMLSKMHVSHDQLVEDGVWEDVDSMVKDLVDACEMRDVAGLTPFLRAAKEKNLDLLKLICDINVAVLVENQVDHDGNNFWHLLADMQVWNYTQTHTILCQDLLLDSYRRHSLVDQNKKGDTPLHIAIQNNNFQIAQIFIEILKEIQMLDDVLNKCNNDGNAPFHLVAGKSNSPDANKFIQYAFDNYSSQNTHFVGMPNKERNIPLHLAISKGDFGFAQILIQNAIDTKYFDKIRGIRNDQNKTPFDLIGSAQHLTYEFERFIWENSQVASAILGVRSLSGISPEKITDHMSTMGVIAALFATITFTAAFTTPGGLNSDGTPSLMKNIAFKVFMVSDIIAMCLSMLVLFSLFWIMTVGTKRDQVVLLDLAVLFLGGAFKATILTFMMGVFVTVYPVSHWIAILTCVLCSLLILAEKTNVIQTSIRFINSVYNVLSLKNLRPVYNQNVRRIAKLILGHYGQSSNQQIASLPSSGEP